ncbi:DUF817 domain-containing protein [Frigidibacter sp. SLM-1]|nr:DUF817 domain-containing protein [Frigidibacter sp. ROC022]MCR8723037.1 DUF817 domain-containing protein [Frigidibacter sp. ROC022]
MFVLKQGWAALFGILLLVGLLASKALWQPGWPVARYDALVLYAIGLQVLFLWARLETLAEARVILLFHLTGTAMEIFKIRAGSWAYPEPGMLKLLGVPLFSGFMYASVGSYMARVMRIFEMRFAPFPPYWQVATLAVAIYVNFFAHHYLPDIRLALFAATALVFLRTRIWFYVHRHPYWMPLPVAALLSSFFLWIAENIGTLTGTWVYALTDETQWHMVSFAKMGSWYLLLYVAFATVTLVTRDMLSPVPLRPEARWMPGADQPEKETAA